MDKPKTILILENIRSVFNVGGIFRTADAAGVDHIYLVGYTPTPIDRFGRKRKDFHKAALGAEDTVSWTHFETTQEVVGQLQPQGFTITSVEQDAKSVSYKDIPTDQNIALIFGNEVDGVQQSTLDQSNFIAEIPMLGQKESLNVGVSVGIFLFR
jgi:23S rRNA (guanosine2251-2'-O)-methyltransferase